MLNIMNPPADWSTLKKLIWLRGTPITGGEELTVSGTPPLSLPNSLGKPLKAWSVDLLPYQEGTGDPAPDNVRPIHGTDKLTITTAGKNLLNLDAYGISRNAYNITKIPNYLKPNTTYTFSINGTTTYTWGLYLSNGGDLAKVLVGQNSAGSSTTFTTPANMSQPYLVLTGGTSGAGTETVEVIKPQVELGSSASAYESYQGNTYTITLPQTVYTGTIGSEGGESRWGEVDLGTLNWNASSPENHVFRSNSLQGRILTPSTGLIVTNAICEQFSAMGYAPLSASDNGKFAVADSADPANGRIVFIDHRWDSTDDFITAVSGVKLVYPLINLTQFAVTTPTIPTPRGTATTWATAEDGTVESMEVTYVGEA